MYCCMVWSIGALRSSPAQQQLHTFQGRPPAHSANASYVGLPVAAAARMSMQLVASLAHATSSIVSTPTSTPVLEMAKGIGSMELQQTKDAGKQGEV
jgi:hypothetical protein